VYQEGAVLQEYQAEHECQLDWGEHHEEQVVSEVERQATEPAERLVSLQGSVAGQRALAQPARRAA
jgi:hypothetical protein